MRSSHVVREAPLDRNEYLHSRRLLDTPHLYNHSAPSSIKPAIPMSLSSSAILAAATLLSRDPQDPNNIQLVTRADDLNCGAGGGDQSMFGLRVASIFIILIGSTFGALFPVVAKRSTWLHVPKSIFEYVLFLFFFLSSSDP